MEFGILIFLTFAQIFIRFTMYMAYCFLEAKKKKEKVMLLLHSCGMQDAPAPMKLTFSVELPIDLILTDLKANIPSQIHNKNK